MIINKRKKNSIVIPIVIAILIFYMSLRVLTAVEQNSGIATLDLINNVINNIYRIDTKLIITGKTLGTSLFISVFALMVYETIRLQNRKNVQENTHGSAEWRSPKDIAEKRDKVFENNMILTQTELISKNMRISKLNRHVLLVGKPGTGKSRYYFKPNILNANGTIIVTDPKRRVTK